MPKITCITTTYNEGELLLTAVESVLNQSFADFEYLIIDDGSSQETLEILGRLSDPRLRVIRQANAGLSAARNAGIALALGDYICFLDADDLRPNWSFAAIASVIDAAQPDLVLCPGMLCDLRGQIEDFYDAAVFRQIAEILPGGVSERRDQKHTQLCVLAQQLEPQSANKVVRRSFLKATGLRFPAPFFFEDIFFHTNAIVQADRIAILDCPAFTYFRRYQRRQITTTAGELRFDILAVVRLTLDAFALRPEFGNLAYRGVVFASCLKLIDWCENCLGHPLRAAFQQNVQEMMASLHSGFSEVQFDQGLHPAFLTPLCRHLGISEERMGQMYVKPPTLVQDHQVAPPFGNQIFDPDERIEVQAFGRTICILAPKIDFLRTDSLYRLRHIYQPALAAQTLAVEGVALDIGAGFGVFALPFALAYPGWKVFCFEPDPTAFAFLQINICNLALSQITALPFAIGHEIAGGQQDAKAVEAALRQLMFDPSAQVDRLAALLPLIEHSKSKINIGYLERGHNASAEFDVVQVPTLAAQALEVLAPTLVKLIAPKAEAEIISDLSQSKIDHVIGESWQHIPSAIIHAPSMGLRQTWIPRAGQSNFGLRRSVDLAGKSLSLDVVLALPFAGNVDFAWITALLSDPSKDINVLVVGDKLTKPAKAAMQACSRNDPRVRFLHRPIDTQVSAWNFGRLQSAATHIAFVDAQSHPGKNFFAGLLDLARQTGAEVVQGPFRCLGGDNILKMAPSVSRQETHASPMPRFEIFDTTYHYCGVFELMAEPPTIWRRVYRRDFLDNRRIWFPDHLASTGEFVFQTLSLNNIPDVPSLDGVIFGHGPSKPAGQDLALCTLESFRILLNRAGVEGWNDLSPLFQTIAFQLNACVTHMILQDTSAFLQAAAKLWAYAHKAFGAEAFDQAPLDLFEPSEFAQQFNRIIAQLDPLSTAQAWDFLEQTSAL